MKYKVCVYAICKNEEKFVEKWMDSVSEADEVYVLDTGSTDNTVELLKEHGAIVYVEEIKPWRFDVARNKSLSLVPSDTDICVCIDLDEVFDKGWRQKLEEVWENNTNRLAYNYIWSFDKYNNPATNFYIEKIHDRNNYIWKHPVHEVLNFIGGENEIKKITDEITVKHYPDLNKPRSSYLPLLELSIMEEPLDDRNMHYLGREYMYYEKWNEAIDTLIKHLNLKNATWKEERSASMRYISRCYNRLNRIEEAKMWLDKAIIETPNSREPYVEYAFLAQQIGDYNMIKDLLEKALLIKNRGKTYINENFCWDSTIYDLLSIAYFNLKDYDKALENVNEALKLSSTDERIIENKNIIIDAKNKS